MVERQRILVTGCGGFLGRPTVVRLLANGRTVTGFDQPEAETPDGISVVTGDLIDPHRVYAALLEAKPTHILHLAALSGPMLARDDPHRMVRVNILGTANLLEAARLLGVERFVFLSSIMAYGPQPTEWPVSEDAPLNAADAYGASKIAGESLMRTYARSHGLDTVSLRVSAVFGPGRRTDCLIRQMLEDALAGRVARVGFGQGCHRQYVYVDDVVEGMVKALATPRLPRAAYNITGGTRMTLDRVVETAARAVPGLRAELGGDPHPFDDPIGPLDITAAREELGYAPAVSLADGIRRYRDWMAARENAGASS